MDNCDLTPQQQTIGDYLSWLPVNISKNVKVTQPISFPIVVALLNNFHIYTISDYMCVTFCGWLPIWTAFHCWIISLLLLSCYDLSPNLFLQRYCFQQFFAMRRYETFLNFQNNFQIFFSSKCSAFLALCLILLQIYKEVLNLQNIFRFFFFQCVF